MTTEMEEATCKQVAKFLPEAIRKAFHSYYQYIDCDWHAQAGDGGSQNSPSISPKSFMEHQAACKAALAHIELLLKLGKMAHIETRIDQAHLAIIKQSANNEVEDFYTQEDQYAAQSDE